MASSSQHKGIVLRLKFVASKHFMYGISRFHSFYEHTARVSFITAARTVMTSRAVGAVKFKAKDDRGDFGIITIDNVYFALH